MNVRKKEFYKNEAEILHSIFDEWIEDTPCTEVGNFLVIWVDGDRNIKLNLEDSYVRGEYDAIELQLISKTQGKFDYTIVHFADIFEHSRDLTHPNKLRKYIHCCPKGYTWYGMPDESDYIALRRTLENYFLAWV